MTDTLAGVRRPGKGKAGLRALRRLKYLFDFYRYPAMVKKKLQDIGFNRYASGHTELRRSRMT